ncbi:MAG: histidine phosphatase family protein [Pseudomonadota bacterium]|jgi:broad specificity phosphatase PhoE|nr:histidine phosphatase family protein [Pseudomonadota bacterium]
MNTTSGPRFLLLRHGQINANKTGHWHGSTDSPLNFRGRRQARRTGQHLVKSETQLDAAYASPLIRCQQTATLALRHTDLPILTVAALREMSIGEWEGQSFLSLRDEHDLFEQLKDPDYAPPGGESLQTVAARMCQVLVEISKQHQAHEHILIVSHGVAMSVALASLIENSPSLWRNYHLDNCSLTEVLVSPKPVVLSFNQSGHL